MAGQPTTEPTHCGLCGRRLEQHREGCLVAKNDRLIADLAECYRLTGADTDGNEDWRLARHAVEEVRRLREEMDEADDRIVELERAIAEHKRRCVEDDHEPTEHEGMAVFTSTVDLWSTIDT